MTIKIYLPSWVSKERTKNILLSILFLAVATWLTDWAIAKLPPRNIHFSQFWNGMIYRGRESLFWVAAMWAIMPSVFSRFRIRVDWRKFLICLAIIIYMRLPALVDSNYGGFAVIDIVGSFFWAMSIGVVEEIFSRGFIFGYFEKYGIWIATIISSVHFGLLHFGNIFWGDYSVGYTTGQVIDAAAFGVMECGLMLFTGSIWVPILFHGLTDLPMQFMTNSDYQDSVTGSFDWFGTFFEAIVYITIGFILIQNRHRSIREILISLGLIESAENSKRESGIDLEKEEYVHESI